MAWGGNVATDTAVARGVLRVKVLFLLASSSHHPRSVGRVGLIHFKTGGLSAGTAIGARASEPARPGRESEDDDEGRHEAKRHRLSRSPDANTGGAACTRIGKVFTA
jgi:hypothetical protein